ncbi:siderophore-interacting protein [Cutibacterium equinum]|uniref:Siderophore-interacting protein n=1 Tax=Cutibacterium equinum TaxID=3016342 RepID=A0ABY7R1P3_9ACTN|nr:siderophore-interacting protein [Cutibacterium equinum]WCC81203.1 siderophore-interacting protein [Cutibacterium equinum]
MPSDLTHVLAVADAVALPAVANTLASLPESARATVVIVEGHHIYPLPDNDRVTIVTAPRDPEGIFATVRDLDLPRDTHAFVHGQAAMVRPMRRHLRLERGLPKERVHLSAYWFAGRDADGWRAMKKDFNRSMEAESGD